MALILSAVDFMALCLWGSLIMLVIDRYGRKPLMLQGAIGCGICFTLTTIGLGIGTKPSYAMAVSFMFGYHLFYVSPDRLFHLCEIQVVNIYRASRSSQSPSSTPLKLIPPACAASVIPSP
jgi:MFS family permease